MEKNRHFTKKTNGRVTQEYIDKRAANYAEKGYPKTKWMEFCEWALREGYGVRLYEARQTCSKYVTLDRGPKSYKVRFSNHLPTRERELNGDCDFFVGITHTGKRTTEDAMEAVESFFKA